MHDDPRVTAARYRRGELADEHSEGEVAPSRSSPMAPTGAAHPPTPTVADRAAFVEVAIQQAIRRGDFDDLPGAGQPIPDLGDHHDPDWWIRRKIRSERLSGLGPPALTLRVESTTLSERLDALRHESDVREVLEDFNRRVIEARRQLLGGPPVVTTPRDIDAETRAWRERRDARARERGSAERDATPARRRRWFRGHRSRDTDESRC